MNWEAAGRRLAGASFGLNPLRSRMSFTAPSGTDSGFERNSPAKLRDYRIHQRRESFIGLLPDPRRITGALGDGTKWTAGLRPGRRAYGVGALSGVAFFTMGGPMFSLAAALYPRTWPNGTSQVPTGLPCCDILFDDEQESTSLGGRLSRPSSPHRCRQ